MTEADEIARKAREDNEKIEIIERLRKKAKKMAEKIGDILADKLLNELDNTTIKELEEMEKDTDGFLSGKTSSYKPDEIWF